MWSCLMASLPDDCSEEDIDPVVHGFAILEIQRAHLMENDGIDGKFCAVGGFAQITTVTAGALTSRVVNRWRDQVGKKIKFGSSKD
jgi:hypothetical protein